MTKTPKFEAGEIGPQLVLARRHGWQWKELENFYGLGRTQLWKLWRGEIERSKAISEHIRP